MRVARREPGIDGHRATKRLLGLGLVARGDVRSRQQHQQRRVVRLLGDFGLEPGNRLRWILRLQVEVREPAQGLDEAGRELERPLERAPRAAAAFLLLA